jgi:hypothetical protein
MAAFDVIRAQFLLAYIKAQRSRECPLVAESRPSWTSGYDPKRTVVALTSVPNIRLNRGTSLRGARRIVRTLGI